MKLRSPRSTAEPPAVPPVTIRRLRPGDDEVLTYLARHNDRFGGMKDRVELDPLDAGDSFAFLRDDRTATFVAFVDEEPVGFVYTCELYRRHTALRHLCVYEIGVSDQHRNHGIGPALLEAVADHARAQGIERGFVITQSSDRAAMSLFEGADGERTATDEVVFTFVWS